MRKLLSLLFLTLCFYANSFAQPIYFEPSPVVFGEPVRLYVSINSGTCNCPELLDADPIVNPLYIWTWGPVEDRPPVNGINVVNGDWQDSNENMRMHQDSENPNLWYFDFLDFPLEEFYSVNVEALINNGVSFLIKEKNGTNINEGVNQKSDDMNLSTGWIVSDVSNEENRLVLSLYPNPSQGMLTISSMGDFESDGTVSIQLRDVHGKLIIEDIAQNIGEAGVQLDYSSFPAGMYLVQISDEKSILASKVLILH